MDGELFKCVNNFKIGDKIYFHYHGEKVIRLAVVSGTSKKYIYVNDNSLKIKKYSSNYPYVEIDKVNSYYGYKTTIVLVNSTDVLEEDKIKLEKEYLIHKIIKEEKLKSLNIQELYNIYNIDKKGN